MNVYRKEFDVNLGQMIWIETNINEIYKSTVDTVADLPISGNSEGDVRLVLTTNHLYGYINGTWVDQGVFDIHDHLEDIIMQILS